VRPSLSWPGFCLAGELSIQLLDCRPESLWIADDDELFPVGERWGWLPMGEGLPSGLEPIGAGDEAFDPEGVGAPSGIASGIAESGEHEPVPNASHAMAGAVLEAGAVRFPLEAVADALEGTGELGGFEGGVLFDDRVGASSRKLAEDGARVFLYHFLPG